MASRRLRRAREECADPFVCADGLRACVTRRRVLRRGCAGLRVSMIAGSWKGRGAIRRDRKPRTHARMRFMLVRDHPGIRRLLASSPLRVASAWHSCLASYLQKRR